MSKLNICLTTLTLALGAGVVYIAFKRKYKQRDAAKALDYLNIKIVTTQRECDQVVEELRKNCGKHRAIGFDCEWVTQGGSRQPVALMQLSTYNGLCGLFRLNQLENMPESLKELLEDESIYKLGVASIDDAKYLHEDYSVIVKSILDLRHIVGICGHRSGGLAALSKTHLGIILDKSWRIRCSDWEADTLTEKQVKYAAADAHVAIRIFVKVLQEYGNTSVLSFCRRKSDSEIWANLDELCQGYVDLGFKEKLNIKNVCNKTLKGNLTSCKRYPNATRSKPLYHNCFLQAPDGELLCTCDDKKAYWYVEKGLAVMVQEEPLTVRLLFEPAGRSVGDVGRYYQLIKENKCVVCGSTNSYIRKNVVPREYRKYFPEIMKDHSSHDVVLLCTRCHQRSNMKDLDVRLQLADRCHAPLSNQGPNSKYLEDADSKKIRSAARALLYQSKKHEIPVERRKELEKILLKHYPEYDSITEDLLREATTMEVIYQNMDYESHGEKVVEYFMKEQSGLLRLEELWRQHFIDSMKPKYLPELWSVKHNEERLLVKFNEGRLSGKDLKLIGLTHWLF